MMNINMIKNKNEHQTAINYRQHMKHITWRVCAALIFGSRKGLADQTLMVMDFTDSSHKLFGELQFHLALVVTLRLRNIADHRQGVSGLRTTKIVKIDSRNCLHDHVTNGKHQRLSQLLPKSWIPVLIHTSFRPSRWTHVNHRFTHRNSWFDVYELITMNLFFLTHENEHLLFFALGWKFIVPPLVWWFLFLAGHTWTPPNPRSSPVSDCAIPGRASMYSSWQEIKHRKGRIKSWWHGPNRKWKANGGPIIGSLKITIDQLDILAKSKANRCQGILLGIPI